MISIQWLRHWDRDGVHLNFNPKGIDIEMVLTSLIIIVMCRYLREDSRMLIVV